MAVATSSIIGRSLITDRATKFGLKNEAFVAKVLPCRATGNGGDVKGNLRFKVKATTQIGGLR